MHSAGGKMYESDGVCVQDMEMETVISVDDAKGP